MSWQGRRLHFVAIGGAGMSGLALVAHRLGAEVSGSDRSRSGYTERLRDAGIEPSIGHDADQVPSDADVVVSTAIPADNPELVRARERGQRVIHRGAMLAELCATGRLVAVAGTHGKTTTTGMLVHALRAMGEDPTFFIGGELPGAGPEGEPANAGLGEGELVVAEADESDASFLELRPEVAVVTNVELDHHARWGSRAELEAAFADFARPSKAAVLGPGESLDGVATALGGGSRIVRFSATDPVTRVELGVPGAHNVLNAQAALAAIECMGLDPQTAAGALAGFPGMLRRQELKGETASGARIYDDYAHHPTEVEATLAALRELGPRRLIAVFQPHLYSRTKALAQGFGIALAGAADVIAVLDVYAAREEPVGELAGVSGLDVARAAADRAGGREVMWLGDKATAARVLAPRLREGDLLVTIGAGDVFELAEALVG